jgi:hypothetical protein
MTWGICRQRCSRCKRHAVLRRRTLRVGRGGVWRAPLRLKVRPFHPGTCGREDLLHARRLRARHCSRDMYSGADRRKRATERRHWQPWPERRGCKSRTDGVSCSAFQRTKKCKKKLLQDCNSMQPMHHHLHRACVAEQFLRRGHELFFSK